MSFSLQSSLQYQAALVDKMAKLPKPVPFLYMAQKAATYVEIFRFRPYGERNLRKITVKQTVFPCGMLRASFFVFFAVCDNP
jgi:hypothetical protein